MKKIIAVVLLTIFFILPVSARGTVSVHGYFKSNGTYVAPYIRTSPNSTKLDNFSCIYGGDCGISSGGYSSPYSTFSTYSSPPVTNTVDSLCKTQYGSNSYGNSGKNVCYCNTGFMWNTTNTSCISSSICPDMINGFYGSDGGCFCRLLYNWDSTKNQCVPNKYREITGFQFMSKKCSGIANTWDNVLAKCVTLDFACKVMDYKGYSASLLKCV